MNLEQVMAITPLGEVYTLYKGKGTLKSAGKDCRASRSASALITVYFTPHNNCLPFGEGHLMSWQGMRKWPPSPSYSRHRANEE